MKLINGVWTIALVLSFATIANGGTKDSCECPAQIKKQVGKASPADGHVALDLNSGLPGQKEGPLDRALTAKVRNSLAPDSGSSATGPSPRSDIAVSSFHGVVTLRGKVNSQAERQALVDKVQSLGGVTIVKNELEVTPASNLNQGSPAQRETEVGSSTAPGR